MKTVKRSKCVARVLAISLSTHATVRDRLVNVYNVPTKLLKILVQLYFAIKTVFATFKILVV